MRALLLLGLMSTAALGKQTNCGKKTKKKKCEKSEDCLWDAATSMCVSSTPAREGWWGEYDLNNKKLKSLKTWVEEVLIPRVEELEAGGGGGLPCLDNTREDCCCGYGGAASCDENKGFFDESCTYATYEQNTCQFGMQGSCQSNAGLCELCCCSGHSSAGDWAMMGRGNCQSGGGTCGNSGRCGPLEMKVSSLPTVEANDVCAQYRGEWVEVDEKWGYNNDETVCNHGGKPVHPTPLDVWSQQECEKAGGDQFVLSCNDAPWFNVKRSSALPDSTAVTYRCRPESTTTNWSDNIPEGFNHWDCVNEAYGRRRLGGGGWLDFGYCTTRLCVAEPLSAMDGGLDLTDDAKGFTVIPQIDEWLEPGPNDGVWVRNLMGRVSSGRYPVMSNSLTTKGFMGIGVGEVSSNKRITVWVKANNPMPSHPGVIFHWQDKESWAAFYFRPHESGKAKTTTCIEYRGGNYTTCGRCDNQTIPINDWFEVIIETAGSNVALTIGGVSCQVEVGYTRGRIGLMQHGAVGYFKDMVYEIND